MPSTIKESVGRWSDEVRSRLSETGYPSLRRLEVWSECGSVVVRGAVPSFYLKQLAQTIAGEICGMARVRNETVVVRLADSGID